MYIHIHTFKYIHAHTYYGGQMFYSVFLSVREMDTQALFAAGTYTTRDIYEKCGAR